MAELVKNAASHSDLLSGSQQGLCPIRLSAKSLRSILTWNQIPHTCTHVHTRTHVSSAGDGAWAKVSSASSRFTFLLESLLEKTRVVLLLFFSPLNSWETWRSQRRFIYGRSHSRASAARLDSIPAVSSASRAGAVSGEFSHLLTCYQIYQHFFSILGSILDILDSNRAALHH